MKCIQKSECLLPDYWVREWRAPILKIYAHIIRVFKASWENVEENLNGNLNFPVEIYYFEFFTFSYRDFQAIFEQILLKFIQLKTAGLGWGR